MMKALVSALLLTATVAAAQPALPHKHKHGAILATDPLPDVLTAVANETMIFEINRKDLASSGMKPDAGKRALADAQICSAAVASALASQPPATPVQVGAKPVALGDADAQFCAPLAAIVKSFDSDRADAKAKASVKLLAPYKAAGITGDKLQLAYRDTQLYGVGGVTLAVPQLKTANVIFELEGGGPTPWSLTRYEYRGDKLIGTTSQHYLRRPGASKFR
jgi:hypothetical protein